MPDLAAGQPTRFDFLYGAVAARGLPALRWRRAHRTALLRQRPRLYYALPKGDAAVHRALQGCLTRARRLARVAEPIVIVHGSQQAIDL